MKLIICLLGCLAAASAKPGFAYSAVAPLTTPHFPYSFLPYHHAPLAYHAAPLAYAAPVAPVIHAAPVGVKTQYHSQDELGQAAYGHAEPHQAHSAVQDAAGNKVGSFSYVKPDGTVAQTSYVADALGYRVASNDLPVGPAAPIPDTPEVVAARAAHLAEVEKAKMRTKRDLAVFPAATGPLAFHHPYAHPYAYPYSYPFSYPLVTPSGYLADTPEVASAKVAHFIEHAKARSRVRRGLPVTTLYSHHVPTIAHTTSHLAYTTPAVVHPYHHTLPYSYGRHPFYY